MKLVLLGPPGAGKGTQAKQMIDKYSIPQISTGDILRQAVKDGTQMGKEAKTYMDKGELVPDGVIIGIVKDRIQADDCKDGYIFDGFPRTVAQAEALDSMLNDLGTQLDAVVSIEVPEEDVVKRLSGRRTCKSCGTLFHVMFNPPAKEDVCDACGGELYQRDDDNETTIRQRLSVYTNQTSPLIDYYSKAEILKPVPGTGAPDTIFEAICKVLA